MKELKNNVEFYQSESLYSVVSYWAYELLPVRVLPNLIYGVEIFADLIIATSSTRRIKSAHCEYVKAPECMPLSFIAM